MVWNPIDLIQTAIKVKRWCLQSKLQARASIPGMQ